MEGEGPSRSQRDRERKRENQRKRRAAMSDEAKERENAVNAERARRRRAALNSPNREILREESAERMRQMRAELEPITIENQRREHTELMQRLRTERESLETERERTENAQRMQSIRAARDPITIVRERLEHANLMQRIRSERDVISDERERTENAERIQRLRLTERLETHNIARNNNVLIERLDIGRMDVKCSACGALHFKSETRSGPISAPLFQSCCSKGHVVISQSPDPPPYLFSLLTNSDPVAKAFRLKIRAYNSGLSFTSCGTTLNETISSRGIYTYKIHGQMYHRIGSLLPSGETPKFMQMYFYDTDHELENRLGHFRNGDGHDGLDRSVLQRLQQELHQINPHIRQFKNAIEQMQRTPTADVRLVIKADRPGLDRRTYNLPNNTDIAVIMDGDGLKQTGKRDIVLQLKSNQLQRINEAHRYYDPLLYILLFPFGDYGWDFNVKGRDGRKVTAMDYYGFLLHIRDNFNLILRGRRLLQQYVVDMWAKIEQDRLEYWLRAENQKSLRTAMLQGVEEAINEGEVLGSAIGQRIILPSSFINSARNMIQLYQDAMSIVATYGKPDLFITFTCNPKWPEITRELLEDQTANDRPDLCVKVFKEKLENLREDLINREVLGKVSAYIYVIEFQKRGLPHCHILLILDSTDKPRNTDDYDTIVCAELPDKVRDNNAFETVSSCMIHGPCGTLNPKAPCMDNGKCTKEYPKAFTENTSEAQNGYPVYRRRDDGSTCVVKSNNREYIMDNRNVVPYNIYLVKKYNAHINVEICSTIAAVKYLYKYVYKGPDKAFVEMTMGVDDGNEVLKYLNARYLSSSESCWRIFGYSLHLNRPNICRLQIHLENQQSIIINDNDALENITDRYHSTTLTAWFAYNTNNGDGLTRTYTEFPQHYIYLNKKWRKRIRGESKTIGRMYLVSPTSGEKYFLRMLLSHVRGARSFSEMRTVSGVIYDTYKDAALALGLLEDDNEWNECLREASLIKTGRQMRQLFVTILLFCSPTSPENLWNAHKSHFIDDLVFRYQNYEITAIENHALIEINKMLQQNNKDLSKFPNMPIPNDEDIMLNIPRIVEDEISTNIPALIDTVHSREQMLNIEQKIIYEKIFDTVSNGSEQNVFFIDGYGGTGKTFLYNTLLDKVRSMGWIALAVASSGIAAILLNNGRTAHSRFKIPVNIHESSTCNIAINDDLAHLIRMSRLIVWDEAPLTHKHVFEAVDRTFKDIMQSESPFGGKVIVFGGDFRQVLPVVKHGTRVDIVNACIKHSTVWNNIVSFQLNINMRLSDSSADSEYGSFLLKVGEGLEIGADGDIMIPDEIAYSNGSLDEFIATVFPDLENWNKESMMGRAILTSKNETVDIINHKVMERFPGEIKEYLSANKVSDPTVYNTYPLEFLDSLNVSGLPPHRLILKNDIPVMLLRNLSPALGLCNGTQLICKNFQQHVIEAEITSGNHIGDRVFIPRMTMAPSDFEVPFTRRQFPIRPSFAMTINKSQGQTLNYVGLYLPEPVFTHGQLYVAMSRVRSQNNIKVLIDNKGKTATRVTKNIVFREVLS